MSKEEYSISLITKEECGSILFKWHYLKDISKGFNLASWFVSKTIKSLRRSRVVRSILSYADNDHHKGTVYRACNFSYYGLTTKKKDFWILQGDGSYTKHSRGKTKGVAGEWRDRSQKHRFVITIDKHLKMLWEKEVAS